MSHTPEPWTWDKAKPHKLKPVNADGTLGSSIGYFHCGVGGKGRGNFEEDKAHILACVNGCAGLNPAAYREVLDALSEARGIIKRVRCNNYEQEVLEQIDQALAHATGGQP